MKPIGGDLLVDLPVVGPLSYESFTPELIRCKELTASQRERVEKMKETFAKVTAFLQASGMCSYCTVASLGSVSPGGGATDGVTPIFS